MTVHLHHLGKTRKKQQQPELFFPVGALVVSPTTKVNPLFNPMTVSLRINMHKLNYP